MSNVHIKFDDIDQYELSDSENEEERLILNKNYKKIDVSSDSEEEVFGLQNDDSDYEENDDLNIANSDIEDEDELPNVRAWGKSKRNFYSTDYVDQDYGGYEGKDAQAANFEEKEAKAIQIRLTEQLNDEDFMLNFFQKEPIKSAVVSEPNEEIIKSDLSTLSKRELKQLLEKESPEMLFLINDCKSKLSELKYLYPIINKINTGLMEYSQVMEFLKTFYNLILNYTTNVYIYLLLKASKENLQKHPVLKRLYQYRKLISELESLYTEIVKPQLEIILNEETSQITSPKKEIKKVGDIKQKNKKVKFVQIISAENIDEAIENTNDVQMEIEDQEHSKRAITYQIAKNKGLIPKRKKEQRNPRVKHRNKFRKATIRRKGAVREVRKELKRYGGEVSGIKANVSKSTKLK